MWGFDWDKIRHNYIQFDMQKVAFHGTLWVLSEEYIWVDLPFYRKLSYLPVYFYYYPDSSKLDWLMLFPLNRQRGSLELSNHTKSRTIPHYFVLLHVSRTLGGVSAWLASHIFLQHLCVICVKHISAQAAVNCFTGTSCVLVIMKSFRIEHCCSFCFGLEEKAFERVKLAGEGVRAWYHQAYWKSRLMYIDFTQVLKYSGLQNFL